MSTILGGAVSGGDCGCDCSAPATLECADIPDTIYGVISGITSLGCVSFPGYGPGPGWNCLDLGGLNGTVTLTYYLGDIPPLGGSGEWICPGGDEACNFGGSVDNYSDDGCGTDLATYANAGTEYTLVCNLNAGPDGPDGNLFLQFTLATGYGAYAFNVGSGSVVVTQADIDAQGFTIALSGGDLYSGGTLTISW